MVEVFGFWAGIPCWFLAGFIACFISAGIDSIIFNIWFNHKARKGVF